MLVSSAKPTIERIVLIHNPPSQKLAEQCMDELQTSRLGKPVVRLLSRWGGAGANSEMLYDTLEPGDAIGLVAGDGTFRSIAGALLRPELGHMSRQVTITSLAGGNARDIGRALHGRRQQAPSKIFTDGLATTAYAMKCTIGDATHDAISYIGYGKTADGSRRVNLPGYRNGVPLWRDAKIGIGGLVSNYEFAIVDDNGDRQRLSDLTFSKGPCMAKIANFPVKHWEPRIRITPAGPGFIASTLAVAGMGIGHAPGHYETEPYLFTTASPVLAHFDGEPPIEIEPDTPVSVGLAPNTYQMLTTRL